jgi:hypothetical protein
VGEGRNHGNSKDQEANNVKQGNDITNIVQHEKFST